MRKLREKQFHKSQQQKQLHNSGIVQKGHGSCRPGTCLVRQIVWENSKDCFNGRKIYDQTKCRTWACDPYGSGVPKQGKKCTQGHVGIATRFQYLDFEPQVNESQIDQ